MIKKFLLSLSLLLLLNGCNLKDEYVMFNQSEILKDGSKTENLNRVYKTRIDPATFEYKIRPHDRISLITYNHPQLSTGAGGNAGGSGLGENILVSSRGELRLPLIKNIKISGLSQPEAQYKLEDAFAEYLKSPSIQLEVLNKRAFVLGEVNRPGPIVLQNEQLPLLQLLAIAGDLTTSANRKSIIILKNEESGIVTKVVSLTDINAIKVANQMIRPNDIVYVVPNGMSLFNNKINELNPIFQLVSNALSPFLSIRILTQ
ncbi:MAG: polysaccharide biosynthesis/export family protein [Sulfurovaceae bacterium]|nr:polysaccharide biosynthesis/export family protein [Sulfurovaceae bacterium]